MVVSSSGTLRETSDFEQGIAIWQERGYRVTFSPHWHQQNGYLAGSDRQRREALAIAWSNPDCKAILCTRGGYGSMRLLEKWHWAPIPEPKWLIGFSDVTALLWSLLQGGIMGLHAPVLTTLGAEPTYSQDHLFDVLEGRAVAPLTGIGGGDGTVVGRLIPANLTVATHLLGTPLQPDLTGAILAIEDVTEAPYRIDRMLTQWRLSGALNSLGGIALGRFSRCCAPAGIPSWTVEDVLGDRLKDLNIPTIFDLPFGHDGVNLALPVGAMVELNAKTGQLTWMD